VIVKRERGETESSSGGGFWNPVSSVPTT
jgi:hypothetical protein